MADIWVSTDLHLYNRDNDNRHPYRSQREVDALSAVFANVLREDDILIFLGDLCDPEVSDAGKIAAFIRSIPCTKYMCKGNHDTESDAYYLEAGFDMVCDIIRMHNILFSHKPIKVAPDETNVHGHLHTQKLSGLSYQHINAYGMRWNKDGPLMRLDDLIASATVQELDTGEKEQSRLLKEFEEYVSLDSDHYTNIRDITDEVPIHPIDETVSSGSELDQIIEFNNWMDKNFQYGLRINGKWDPKRNTYAEDWDKYLVVQSPEEIAKSKVGVCWDYVSYEAWYFRKNFPNVEYKTYYMQFFNEEDCPSHTILTFTMNGKHYYFENSFRRHAGVYEAETEEDIVNFVLKLMSDNPDPSIPKGELLKKWGYDVWEYNALDNALFGMHCQEYMTHVMDHGKCWKHTYHAPRRKIKKLAAGGLTESADVMNEILMQDSDDAKYWMSDDETFAKKARKGEAAEKSVAGIDESSATKAEISPPVHLKNIVEKVHTESMKYRKGGKAGNQNCKLCTWAVELQLRGEDVLPRPVYSPRDVVFSIDGHEIVTNPMPISFNSKAEMKRIVKLAGPESRFYVHVNWSGISGGHEFVVAMIGNDVYIVDGKEGVLAKIDDRKAADYFDINFANSYMVRMDNQEINRRVLKYNDISYTTPWDDGADIRYMREHNMLDEAAKSRLKSSDLIFLSPDSDWDESVISPRIPDNYMTKNGYEDKKTPRVCFSTSIDKALRALSQKCSGMKLYVYKPDADNYKVITPTVKQVPDVEITDEKWITEPVVLKCIGQIEVIGDAGGPGLPYYYGKNQVAELYDWKWRWAKQYADDGSVITMNEAAGYKKVKAIVDRIPKEEHHLFYNVNRNGGFIDSPWVKYRDVGYCTVKGKKYGAFIDVYVEPGDPYDGYVVIAAEPMARGTGLTDKLVQNMLSHIGDTGIKTLYWETEYSNFASIKLAERNGFSKGPDTDDGSHTYVYNVKKDALDEAFNGVPIYKVLHPTHTKSTVTLYHGTDRKLDMLRATGIDLGNALQPAGWSIFMWDNLTLARTWAVFVTLRNVRKSANGPKGHVRFIKSDANTGRLWTTSEILEGWKTYAKTANMTAYVYTVEIPVSDVGIGNDSTHNEYTVRYDVKPKSCQTIKITPSLLDEMVTTTSAEHIDKMFKAYKLNMRGACSILLTRDFHYNKMENEAELDKLYSAVADGTLKPGDDIEKYIKKNNIKIITVPLGARLRRPDKFPEISLGETSMASTIDDNHKQKGKMSLNGLIRITIDEEKRKKLSSDYKFLKHFYGNDNWHQTIGWTDKDGNLVAAICVSKPDAKYAGQIWLSDFEIVKEYRGYGLSKQIVDYACRNCGVDALGVAKDNAIARKVYEDYGFRYGKEVHKQDKAGTNRLMYLTEGVLDEAAIGEYKNGILRIPASHTQFKAKVDSLISRYEASISSDDVILVIHGKEDFIKHIVKDDQYITAKQAKEDVEKRGLAGYVMTDDPLNVNILERKYVDRSDMTYEQIVVHECAHAVANSICETNLTRAFQEGIAIYESGCLNADMRREQSRWKRPGKFHTAYYSANTRAGIQVRNIIRKKGYPYLINILKGKVDHPAYDDFMVESAVDYVLVDPDDEAKVAQMMEDGYVWADWKNRGRMQPMILSEASRKPKYPEVTATEKPSVNPNDSLSQKAVDLTFYNKANDPVGTASISSIDTPHGFLYNVEVYKKYRGKGYSHSMMEYILTKYRVDELTVDPDNTIAISLYEKHGFKRKGEVKDPTDGAIVIDMRRPTKLNESVVETHPMERDEKKNVADKYGLRAVGQTHDAAEEDAAVEREKRLKEQARKRDEQLKKARNTKNRKAFIHKVKSHLPGVNNEEASAVDGSDADYLTDDGPIPEGDDFHGKKVPAHRHPNSLSDVMAETSDYSFQMLDHVQFFDRMDEATGEGGLFAPVYVVLIKGNSPVSHVITGFTGSEFTHASISFDSTLTKMYSFAGKNVQNTLEAIIGGFRTENIKDKFYKENDIPYAVYLVPSTIEAVNRMKKRLQYFIDNETKFRFDYLGLIKNFFKIPDDPQYTWFCSRFVADILNAGTPKNKLIDTPSLYRPEDFKTAKFAYLVGSGKAANYNKRQVDQKTKVIVAANKMRNIELAESVIRVSPDNPYEYQLLEYQLSMIDESAVDNFMQYLKSFKIRLSQDGDILITRREYDQLDNHFRESLRMIKTYEAAGNVAGVKDELCKINYMIELINQYYLREDVKNLKPNAKDVRKDMLDLRSVMMNVFRQHLTWVTTSDPKFNFQRYYDNHSKYGKNVVIPKKVVTAVGRTIITALA